MGDTRSPQILDWTDSQLDEWDASDFTSPNENRAPANSKQTNTTTSAVHSIPSNDSNVLQNETDRVLKQFLADSVSKAGIMLYRFFRYY